MATFAEIAPTIAALGITEAQANNYLDNQPEDPAELPDPPLTIAKVVSIADAYYVDGIETAGGDLGLAQSLKLKVHQVKTVIEEITAWEAARNE